MFESLQVAVIDSDRLAHEQYGESEVKTTLQQWWGAEVADSGGTVDRRKIAGIVFSAPEQLSRLEGLLYPRIEAKRRELMAVHEADLNVAAILIDAPKLFEAGVDKVCDAVIFVDADRSIRLERVTRTRGWTEADLERRERLQFPLDKKRANADYVIENNSGIAQLRLAVEQAFKWVLVTFSNTR